MFEPAEADPPLAQIKSVCLGDCRNWTERWFRSGPEPADSPSEDSWSSSTSDEKPIGEEESDGVEARADVLELVIV